MTEELEAWLNENAKVEVSAGGWGWYFERELPKSHPDPGRPVHVRFDSTGETPYVALTVNGFRLYTDSMECYRCGFGDGDDTSAALIEAIPREVAESLFAAYGRRPGAVDEVRDGKALAEVLGLYLRNRTGWTPDRDYFVDEALSDSDKANAVAIRVLGIPHRPEMDAVDGTRWE